MKRILYLPLLALSLLLGGCSNDEPDTANSIFVDPGEGTSFDKWLKANYVDPYNMRILYLLKDVETDQTYNVVPADEKKSKQMCVLMRHLWLEAYEEVADDGIHMVRGVVPKLIHLIGSAEYDAESGTMRLGVAEGGMKITITDVNNLDPYDAINPDGDYGGGYFHTLHHEFAHVLHQTKNYPVEYNELSPADYAPSTWFNRSEAEALELGFITNYAGSQPAEDFVEIISCYVTFPRAEWDRRIEAASAEGRAKILRKLEIAQKYMQDSWGVDLDELYESVQRRSVEVMSMDFDNLGF